VKLTVLILVLRISAFIVHCSIVNLRRCVVLLSLLIKLALLHCLGQKTSLELNPRRCCPVGEL